MEFHARMEEELKCPACRRLYTNPVQLPGCLHSLCLNCAVRLQMPQPMPPIASLAILQQACSPAGRSMTSPVGASGEEVSIMSDASYPDSDEISMVSETDSGVVCSSSRPESYIGGCNQSIANIYLHVNSGTFPQIGITCPVCTRTAIVDERGAMALPKTKALANIVDRYRDGKQLPVGCQLCPSGSGVSAGADVVRPAVQMCEQCEVFYCESCLESYHPSDGSLAKHKLYGVAEGKAALQAQTAEVKCCEHPEERLSMYCVLCKMAVCCVCVQDGRHINHHVQPLGAMCKTQKSELTQTIQTLGEKAKSGTEFIARLKGLQERVEVNSAEFESTVMAQCDELIDLIRRHKKQLAANIQSEKAQKLQTYKDQMMHCSSRLQKTTGLIQFSIEALKETDPSAFLQISTSLIKRISTVDSNFVREMEFEPRTSPDFELRLNTSQAVATIKSLNFVEMKVPGAPKMLSRESSIENNTITFVWEPNPTGGTPDSYVLEIDDGNLGNFREVFAGKETLCTVEGLHFDTRYRARVKAFNEAGGSPYSQCISLTTAKVAWFAFDVTVGAQDVLFSNDNMTVTSSSFDDRVVIGNVGFVKGVHYWECIVDRYENNKDPAFGIARYDVAKDKMLGKDDKGWSMYIDNARSWFIHDSQHVDRTAGGIQTGSVIGVLLDLERRCVSFYLNGEQHGRIAFTGLSGVFYPAVSLNRNVQVTLHSGLELPVDSDADDSY